MISFEPVAVESHQNYLQRLLDLCWKFVEIG